MKKQPERKFIEVITVDTKVQRIGIKLVGKQTIFSQLHRDYSYATNGNRMKITIENY